MTSPTMSMKATPIRTISLGGIFRSSRPSTYSSPAPMITSTTRVIGDDSACDTLPCTVTSGRRSTEGRGWHGASHHAGQRHDGQHVWNHLDELRRNQLQALELDLEGFGCCEQYARDRYAGGAPVA